MQKLTFATWFPGYQPVHAGKDIGMIPRLLKEQYEADTRVLSDSLSELYSRFKNGERYDTFQVYHYTYRSLYAGLLYRLFHPAGKLCLKLDTDVPDRDSLLSISRLLFKLSRYDVITGEHEYIKTFKGQPVLFLPGIVETPRIDAAKENIVLHVGRLGIPEKDSVRALALFDAARLKHPDWSMVLAGPVTPELEQHIAEHYPSMMDGRLIVMGDMDRVALYWLMARARLILSTNISESFGYAVVEAMSLGCVLVGTDLPAYREHTDNGKYGFLDLDLNRAMSTDLSIMAKGGAEYVRARYSPDNIERLWQMIDNDFKTRFHQWYYNSELPPRTSFMGVPVHKYVGDLWNYQEIIFELKPRLIVEFGTLYGGSALYFSRLFPDIPLLSVDITHANVDDRVLLRDNIRLATMSSTRPEVAAMIREMRGDGPVFFILDSDHRKPHVYNELLSIRDVSMSGDYVVVEDSNVNGHPVNKGYGPGPYEAIVQYEAQYPDDYRHDAERENKYGFTFAPNGYLVRR